MHRWFNPRRQLIYRLAHGSTKVVQFLSVHPPIKGSAYISASQPEVDVVGFIAHGILHTLACG
jgi:hypothetical protein